MDTDHQQWIMEEAERVAIYWRSLTRNNVPAPYATELTAAWILGNLRAESEIRLPPDEWEKGID